MFKKLTDRSFLSPIVAFTFLPVAITGILLLLHLSFQGMKNIHEWLGLTFTTFCVFHIAVNWRIFSKYFSRKETRSALLLAVVLTCLCGVIGTSNGPFEQWTHRVKIVHGQVLHK
ncbi:DUF4405 domain-containing protein [Desulfovibrio gilichinskyi]|uniref:Flavinylation-associated cytochrome domain-containing protein n=1 Tax=Desulfovibrio gilichinskyi TaxID=1519643 RepID=A0A1X7EKB9_9BACT|nr:DUF4405 domain-containing protein [Desulfovibrio gilichinskyi]SMF35361.1 protein of unknown function [Desulfovibrio gilichinskyi]